MNTVKYLTLLALTCFSASTLFAGSEIDQGESMIGSVWQLDRNGSSLASQSHGQVIYFFSSDAYQTYRARKFQDWDYFSPIDSRNLVRLKKHQKIKLEKIQFNKAIYAVKLLDGLHAGKTYYLIAEELKKNFIQEKDHVESV